MMMMMVVWNFLVVDCCCVVRVLLNWSDVLSDVTLLNVQGPISKNPPCRAHPLNGPLSRNIYLMTDYVELNSETTENNVFLFGFVDKHIHLFSIVLCSGQLMELLQRV